MEMKPKQKVRNKIELDKYIRVYTKNAIENIRKKSSSIEDLNYGDIEFINARQIKDKKQYISVPSLLWYADFWTCDDRKKLSSILLLGLCVSSNHGIKFSTIHNHLFNRVSSDNTRMKRFKSSIIAYKDLKKAKLIELLGNDMKVNDVVLKFNTEKYESMAYDLAELIPEEEEDDFDFEEQVVEPEATLEPVVEPEVEQVVDKKVESSIKESEGSELNKHKPKSKFSDERKRELFNNKRKIELANKPGLEEKYVPKF